MQKTFFIFALIAISLISCSKNPKTEPATSESTELIEEQSSGDEVGKAVANAALQLSELDVSALTNVTEKLKDACARNKYGLSEEECVQKIDERKDVCMQETAQKYPGQLSNVDRMQEVVGSHVRCMFEK